MNDTKFHKILRISRPQTVLRASQLYLATNFGHCAVLQAIALTLIYIMVKTKQINAKTYNKTISFPRPNVFETFSSKMCGVDKDY